VADDGVRALLPPGDSDTILPVLEGSLAGFGLDAPQDRSRLLGDTLAAAWRECAALLGADPGGWAWGRLHHGLFEHPLHGFPGAEALPDVGPLPVGGSSYSPMHTGYRPGDFRVTMGASVRMVVDVGGWDASVWINAPGQSGDPRSPHYAELAPVWAAGHYVPMLYSPAALEPEIASRLALVPAGGPTTPG
jgi:penicillin amidase